MASIIRSKGVVEDITPKNGKKFSLKEAQTVVGGLVQLVRLANDCILLVNEEGKLLGLPYNEVATACIIKTTRVLEQTTL